MTNELTKNETGLAKLTKESDIAIASMREKFVGLNAKESYAAVNEAIKCCRQLRTKATKVKDQLNKDAIAWQRTVNGEYKRIIGQVREIEDPLKESKASVDDAEKKAKQEALRKVREEEDRRRQEELEQLNRQKAELAQQKREIAEAQKKLEEAQRKAAPEPVAEPAKAIVAPPASVPSPITASDRERLNEWFSICLNNAPEVDSNEAQEMVDELCVLISANKAGLSPPPVNRF